MDVSGKKAVITGASSGIGRAVALVLAREGADIMLVARDEVRLASVRQEIEAMGRRALITLCDTTKDDDVAAMKDKVISSFGTIDILVNNAGVATRGRLEAYTIADWQGLINTNLFGYVRCISAFLPLFLQRRSGYIINVSSVLGLGYSGDVLNTTYITTKSAIIGLSEAMVGYKKQGIKVSCFCPGAVATNIAQNARFIGSAEEIEQMRMKDQSRCASSSLPQSEEVAEALLEGIRREDFLILPDDELAEMLLQQGYDVGKLNSFLKNPPEKALK
ncbi:MAG: SDR family oxidoreductase [Dehalococcoidales bacterium]|nr:SDR family oxidoreductase [Dehalococcoidales bacterium]